ncbi:MAG TPA: hypothetical protein EYN18_09785 [Nitrospirales bacterium]|nr:hypothetical protein [Nitrospirales bacterium]HIA14853.1 hypothetical protein [Nitrospirales bacterium]HIB53484.1 hypothetical protein [Nitrospirales bacterium]HIC05184.1 hypothetical protein [Nitrospirales bacterium]HIO22658.1 hypothetical protein [Nitrospirales bacterium]
MGDQTFFQAKAAIMQKVRSTLEAVHVALQAELEGIDLLAPVGFEPTACQFVKGEHLDHYPYQYLDFPKHFVRKEKFTFRSLFWWGHHFVFAVILEGENLTRYKKNLINRYSEVADRSIYLCLGHSLWEWRYGAGYTLELTSDRRTETAAVLTHRPFFKLARFIPMNDPLVAQGKLVVAGRDALHSLIPVITH